MVSSGDLLLARCSVPAPKIAPRDNFPAWGPLLQRLHEKCQLPEAGVTKLAAVGRGHVHCGRKMKEQTARLNQVLKTAIGALGFSLREVERRLGLSRGYLTRLFAGEMDLKIDHVVEIAGVLGVEPEEIFRLAFPA